VARIDDIERQWRRKSRWLARLQTRFRKRVPAA
jgi:hypothetical protein